MLPPLSKVCKRLGNLRSYMLRLRWKEWRPQAWEAPGDGDKTWPDSVGCKEF